MPAALREVEAVIYSDLGATCSRGLSRDLWAIEIKELQTSYRAKQWQLGDLMVFGRRQFGEEIWQFIDIDYHTVIRYEKLATIFPETRRRKCGLTLHQAVQNLAPEEQDELLDLAIKNDWKREALREEIRARKRSNDPQDSPDPAPDNEPVPAADAEEGDGELPAHYRVGEDGELEEVSAPSSPGPRLVVNNDPEPDPDPLTPSEAAMMLRSAAAADYLPKDIRDAIITVLDDRDQLMRQLAVREKRAELLD